MNTERSEAQEEMVCLFHACGDREPTGRVEYEWHPNERKGGERERAGRERLERIGGECESVH